MGSLRDKRPRGGARFYRNDLETSTAASTALPANKSYSLVSTSTAAPVVYTLIAPQKVGDRIDFSVHTIGSSSVGGGQFHINAGSGVLISSTCDMLSLSTDGAGASLLALSTSRWGLVGNFGGTLSTST
jgi:hypothetical protein